MVTPPPPLPIYENFSNWLHCLGMNAPTGKLTGIEELDVRIADFYRMRSEMLDCFADIEQTLLVYVAQTHQKGFCTTAPLGQKIDAAKKVPAGPLRSKELKAKADAELSKLAELLPVRADMVHSRMELAITTSSQFLAIFKNAKDVTSIHPDALVFTKDEFEKFVCHVSALAKSLAKALAAQNPQLKRKA